MFISIHKNKKKNSVKDMFTTIFGIHNVQHKNIS